MVRSRFDEISRRSLYGLNGFLRPNYKFYKGFGIGFHCGLV